MINSLQIIYVINSYRCFSSRFHFWSFLSFFSVLWLFWWSWRYQIFRWRFQFFFGLWTFDSFWFWSSWRFCRFWWLWSSRSFCGSWIVCWIIRRSVRIRSWVIRRPRWGRIGLVRWSSSTLNIKHELNHDAYTIKLFRCLLSYSRLLSASNCLSVGLDRGGCGLFRSLLSGGRRRRVS